MISILMPVYNNQAHLPDCLESILAQSERGWELLAVDDYSDDESGEILRRYAQLDCRIRPLANTGPKGILPALRLALAHSRGEFITRMDADDLMPPAKLRSLQELLQSRGLGWIATGKIEYFADEALGEGYRRYEAWLNRLMDEGRHYEEIYRECVLPSSAWMARRAELEQCGAFEGDTYPEDYDLCFRFYQHGLRIAACPETIHRWRDHAGRASRTVMAYADHTFMALKLRYFLAIDRQPERPLVLWGAGRKGKDAARRLQQAGVPFHWVCDTPAKIGKEIYAVRLHHFEAVSALPNPQVLVLVAAPDAQPEIRGHLENRGLQPGLDYFFFC
jgi:glycosyltransferase involved in cell wall biosynthesis